MKRLVVMFLVAVMVITAIPFGAVFAASTSESVMEATIWEDFSRSDPGEKFSTTQAYSGDELATMQCVNSLGALGGVNAAKMNYKEEYGYYTTTACTGFTFVYDKPKSTKNIDYMMYYIKLPASTAKDEKSVNWMNTCLSISHLTTSDEYVSSKADMYCEILYKNSTEWKSLKYNSVYLFLPAGFEGYIKIPMTNYKLGNFKYSFDKYKIKETTFKFSKMGGDLLGPAYVNAIYAGTKDADSLKIKLNGEKTARYLTTGLTDADLAPKKSLIDSAMKCEVLQDFTTYSLGDGITKSRAFLIDRKDDAVGKLVNNTFGPFNNTRALEISAPTVGGFMDTLPIFSIKVPSFTEMNDIKSILIYVKSAEHHPLDTARSAISLTLYTQKGKELWAQMGEGKAQYLEKGTNQWFTPQTDSTGRIYLPEKFEGYVMVDLTEMLKYPIYDDLEGRSLISANIGVSAVGGECGSVYIGGIYAITEKAGKSKTLVTFNDCDVYDLSTNGIATGAPSEVKGVEVGDLLTGFPATTDKTYKSTPKKTTDTTAQISWSEHPRAEKYKLEIYVAVKDAETDSTYYECVESKVMDAKDGLETTIEDLEPATRYFTLAYALTSSEATIDVYEISRFSTRMKAGNKTPTQQIVVDDGEEADEEGLGILLYVIIGGAVVLLAAATVVTIIIIKKKRKTK